mgnify:FL=1
MQEEPLPKDATSPVFLRPQFEFKLLRQMGLAAYGGSTFGECYAVALEMQEWDPFTWAEKWAELATTVETQGDQSSRAGHEISAREAYSRAANYFHAAEYYATIAGTEFVQYGERCSACFEKAMDHSQHHWEPVDIEADHRVYPCHFFAPDHSGHKRRTVVIIPGIESCAEEQYFYAGIAALKRGYNVFVFQGPGQAGMMRKHPESYLRNDYEVLLQDVLDVLYNREDVDPDHIAVMGNGLGGYFAARIAVFDRRVKALIANPPFINFHRVLLALIGSRARNIDFTVDDVYDLPDTILQNDMKLFVLSLCRRFGVRRLQELVGATLPYTIEEIVYRIECPTLVVRGEAAYPELEDQAMRFFDLIHSEDKTRVKVPALHVADSHDHVGNLPHLNQRVFDWLDERFDVHETDSGTQEEGDSTQ